MIKDESTDKTIDYVLVYRINQLSNHKRIAFEQELSFFFEILGTDYKNDLMFTKLHLTSYSMQEYAEILRLRLPLDIGDLVEDSISKYLGITDRWFPKWSRLNKTLFPQRKYKTTAWFHTERAYLFDSQNEEFFDASTRILIARHILLRLSHGKDSIQSGIESLIKSKICLCAFPPHDGLLKEVCKRTLLHKEWAKLSKWYKVQPIADIKNYFGVPTAMYFAWCGFYNIMLIIPLILGTVSIMLSMVTSYFTRYFINAVCTSELVMCPLCDKFCRFYLLKESCHYVLYASIFDNVSIVLYSLLVNIWCICFKTFWYQYATVMLHRWGAQNNPYEKDEQPTVHYIARVSKMKGVTYKVNLTSGVSEPIPPLVIRIPIVFVSLTVVILMCTISVGIIINLIILRTHLHVSPFFAKYFAGLKVFLIQFLSAVINMIMMAILNIIYKAIVTQLANLELHRTELEYINSIVVKNYMFHFIEYYLPVIYLAFIRGKVGRPGAFVRVFGQRVEECHPSGCQIDLTVYFLVLVFGKQSANTVKKFLFMFLRARKHKTESTQNLLFENYNLLERGEVVLHFMFLKKVIQFGFVTLFASAFPLAPLFALMHNIIQLRIDAKEFTQYYRRPAYRKNFLSLYFGLMNFIQRLSIFTNSCIIAFTSHLVERVVYLVTTGDLSFGVNFLQWTLEDFKTKSFTEDEMPQFSTNVSTCYYYKFRYPDRKRSTGFRVVWQVFAAKIAFVIVYYCIVTVIEFFIEYFLARVPSNLSQTIQQEESLVRNAIYEDKRRKSTS